MANYLQISFLGLFLTFASPGFSAVLDYSAVLQDVQVSPAVGTVTYQVFDPAVGSFVADADSTGSIFNLSSNNGIVSWNNGVSVFFRIYDPSLGVWVKTNATTLTGFVSAQQSAQGVVTWVSGNRVSSAVYDASRQEWRGGLVDNGSGPTLVFVPTSTVAWIAGKVVGYQVYDPVLGQWTSQTIGYANNAILGNLLTKDGVVAWSADTSINFSTYDPTRGRWANQSVPTGSTFDLRTADGVVSWSSSSRVYAYAYDPLQGAWAGIGLADVGNVTNLRVLSGSVFWAAGGISRTAGYNVTNQVWSADLTPPFAYFGASSLSNNAPHRVYFFDMSLGASSWTWNFDDGTTPSSRRSPFHIFENFDRHNVSLSVTGPAGGISTTNQLFVSDIEAPEGTILINNGDSFTTNIIVNLTLEATDNSGFVNAMRFSNDAVSWSEWEAYASTKIWPTADVFGTNFVYVQYQDVAENISETANDSILVDATPPPTMSFTPSTLSVSEGTNTFPVVVSLSTPFNRPVSADFSTVGGSAFSDEDYLAVQTSLLFLPGQTTQAVNLTIVDDFEVELTESFSLSLANASNAVVSGNASVTILDNDQPIVSFSTNQVVIPEGGNLANVIVKLNGPSAQTIQVYYATTNGTATADVDYVDTNGRLTFIPGQTAASFRVLILQDSQGELNETILMRLSDPVNASLGTPITSTLVILDDDPPSATFTQSDYEIIESGGSASIEVALTKPFDQIVIVDYDLNSGTALAGSDFFDLPGNLLFSPGQTNKSFSVNLINDSLPEDPETVLLSLTGFFNATAGPQINALLTIEDDDTLRLSEPALTAEGFFRMRITGPINQVLDIESSVNATNWIFRESLTNLTGITTYIDREITNQVPRFYRATAP